MAGAVASLTFNGTSVRWIGGRSKEGGIALVRVDGGAAREVDLFARPHEIRTPIITIYGERRHACADDRGDGPPEPGCDFKRRDRGCLRVEPQLLSHLQETDPDLTFSAGWVQAADTFNWSGSGVASGDDPAVGGARVTETAGAKVTLQFRGTSIRWIGHRGPAPDIARVQVDGGVASEVDTYLPTDKVQEVLFTQQPD